MTGFSPSRCPHFEVVAKVRALALSAIAVFVARPRSQAVLASGVLFASIVVQLHVKPFRKDFLNTLEEGALISGYFTHAATFVLANYPTQLNGIVYNLLIACVVAVNLGVLFVFLMLPMRATRRLLRRALARVASSGVVRRIRSMRGSSSNAVAPEAAAKQGNYHKMVDGEMLAKMRKKYSNDNFVEQPAAAEQGGEAAGPRTLGDAPAAAAEDDADADRMARMEAAMKESLDQRKAAAAAEEGGGDDLERRKTRRLGKGDDEVRTVEPTEVGDDVAATAAAAAGQGGDAAEPH